MLCCNVFKYLIKQITLDSVYKIRAFYFYLEIYKLHFCRVYAFLKSRIY